ncbi:MAG: 5'/3'-nucleotidase SurE [Planctomycetaceae bacterium]|nr:5'/3'-nucleotidase SurE [Planctomycetaceae bacterium]
MHILIVNDDGIDAAGLAALERAAYTVTDKVSVVAPMFEHSAQSHAITVREPVIVEDRLSGANLVRYAVKGTPTDCVRLGILELCKEKPDLVLSGINHGANIGWEIFFSGTVSAAAEAYSFGIPAVAFSLASWVKIEFQSASRVAASLLEQFLTLDRSKPWLYNVNIPPVAYSDIRGVRLTRTEPNVKGDGYVSREAPDGRRYFWATWGDRHERSQQLTDPSFDVVAVRERYVSISKLHYEVSAELSTGPEAELFSRFRFQ